MKSFKPLIRGVAALSAIALLALTAACSKPAGTLPAVNSPAAVAPASTATPATATASSASKLGDLSAFRSVAADVVSTVDKGDLPAARARIKDLEVAWDSAEAGLKPRAAQDWHRLDKTVDKALTTLRADTPNQADSQQALANMIQTMDQLSAGR